MKFFKRNNKKENNNNTVKTNAKKYEVIYIDNTTGEEIVKIMTARELDALSFEGWCDVFSYVELKEEV